MLRGDLLRIAGFKVGDAVEIDCRPGAITIVPKANALPDKDV